MIKKVRVVSTFFLFAGFSGFSGRKDLSYGRIEEEPEEDIEEIVYHVKIGRASCRERV